MPLNSALQSYQNSKATDRVVAEVAYNHNKRMEMEMEMEIETTEPAEINGFLETLDFNLIHSKILGSNFSIVGGRYCSIQAKLAAQLRIENTQTGALLTFYQSKLPEA